MNSIKHTILSLSYFLGFLCLPLITLSQEFPPSFTPSLLNGSKGFTFQGTDENSFSGTSVSGAGDINGDGLKDIIIGAFGADAEEQGEVGASYVIFGNPQGFPPTLGPMDLDGTNGFIIRGVDENDNAGTSVSAAGDVNGDRLDDLIIGANYAGPLSISENPGESYIVFGRNTGFPAVFNLSDLDGSNGFIIRGIDANDFFGVSVSGAGDMNGDGFSDLIIGAPFAEEEEPEATGESYLIFGSDQGFPAVLNVSSLDGSNGFTFRGVSSEDYVGSQVSGIGDINGDGFDDVIAGSPFSEIREPLLVYSESYVIFGGETDFPAVLTPLLLDGKNGFIIRASGESQSLGDSFDNAGDVNGDGLNDLLIGAPAADPEGNKDAGKSYIIFGRNTDFPAVFDLTTLDGSNGLAIMGVEENSFAGRSSSAGDIDGDGLSDVIILDRTADPEEVENRGKSFVVFGQSTDTLATFPLATLDGSNGFIIEEINQNDLIGSVSSLGDVNGDGLDDIIIGVPSADPNGVENAGESYIIFGAATTTSISDLNSFLPISIAPNPTSDIVTISSIAFKDSREANILLMDQLGRAYHVSENKKWNDVQLDLSHLPAGVYFLRITLDDQMAIRRIVKQ